MKKLWFAALLSFILFLSACAVETADTDTPPAGNGTDVEQEAGAGEGEAGEADGPEGEEPDAEEPDAMKVGDTVQVGDWEVTLNAFEFKDSLSEGMFSFTPDEGHKLAVSDITVKNKGTSSATFLPVISISRDDVSVKLIYDGNFEFNFTHVLGLSGQLYMESLNPLSSKTGIVIFEVVEEVAESDLPLQLTLSAGKENYVFDVR